MKEKRSKTTRFAGDVDTNSIRRFGVQPDGAIDTSANHRTMARKARQAYIRGEQFFTYKGIKYAVPIYTAEQLKENTHDGNTEQSGGETGTAESTEQVSKNSNEGKTETGSE